MTPSSRTIRQWLLETAEDIYWRVRHPSCRRCPECRLTWEPRKYMAMQDGVCHDCFMVELPAELYVNTRSPFGI